MSPPLAHAGHWLANLLYLAPVLIVVGALAWQSLRDRRRAGEDGEGGEPSTTSPASDPGREADGG